MVVLNIGEDKKMVWDVKKEEVGSREERHSLGKFVSDNACHLPITVRVEKGGRRRSFSFRPALNFELKKVVIFTYHNFTVTMKYEDVVQWIRIFISSNKMYEQSQIQTKVKLTLL